MKKESRLLGLSYIRYAKTLKKYEGKQGRESILEKIIVRGIIPIENINDAENEDLDRSGK
uniref:hypothetical protein n=1 Tax=Clostridium sp. NkU-1 TaxID=1095009 RepID=UPI0006D0E2CD